MPARAMLAVTSIVLLLGGQRLHLYVLRGLCPCSSSCLHC